MAIRDIRTFVGPSVITSLARRTSAGHAVAGQAAAAPKAKDRRKNWRLLIRFIFPFGWLDIGSLQFRSDHLSDGLARSFCFGVASGRGCLGGSVLI
jgi:hypothetical protein